MQDVLLAFSLEICFFRAYINSVKDNLWTVMVAQKGEKMSRERAILDSSPVRNFILPFAQVWPL